MDYNNEQPQNPTTDPIFDNKWNTNYYNEQTQSPRPRRRQKTKQEIFKEKYLPLIIGGTALLMVLVLIGGAVGRSIEKNRRNKQMQAEASQSQSEENTRLQQEAYQLMSQASAQAAEFDYDGAIATLDSFTGDIADFPQVAAKRDEYVLCKSQLVAWDDPSQILSLTFQMLIADPQRAFHDDLFSYSFSRNFLTTAEFSTILDKLYSNGYILIRPEDYIETVQSENGTTYRAKTLYLPEGKKPLLLTQTNVNYHTYLTDGDGDKLPDKGGCGFATKLILDENGNLTNEYIDANGQTHTGPYDMVPILNEFVAQHPDFSFRGAKAVIAVTGYDGLFGYRTNPEAKAVFGADGYNEQIEMAGQIAEALRDDGYVLACYTYENESYESFTATQIKADINGWVNEVVPILGDIDIFVFAQNGDIAKPNTPYSGEKYETLKDIGFGIFYGFTDDGDQWFMDSTDYIRHSRLTLSPNTIKHYSVWFEGIMNTDGILDPSRGEIPL